LYCIQYIQSDVLGTLPFLSLSKTVFADSKLLFCKVIFKSEKSGSTTAIDDNHLANAFGLFLAKFIIHSGIHFNNLPHLYSTFPAVVVIGVANSSISRETIVQAQPFLPHSVNDFTHTLDRFLRLA